MNFSLVAIMSSYNIMLFTLHNIKILATTLVIMRTLVNVDLSHKRAQVIVVTWARGICLMCMPEARGPQARGLRAYI